MKGDQVTLFDKNINPEWMKATLPRQPISTNYGANPWEVEIGLQVNEMIKKHGALPVLNFLNEANKSIKNLEKVNWEFK